MRLRAAILAASLCAGPAAAEPGDESPWERRQREERIITKIDSKGRPPMEQRSKECRTDDGIALRVFDGEGPGYDHFERANVRDAGTGEILEFMPGFVDESDRKISVNGKRVDNPSPRRVGSVLRSKDLYLAELIAQYYNRGCKIRSLTISSHGMPGANHVLHHMNILDLERFKLSEAFTSNAVVKLESCDAGTGLVGAKFAEDIAKVFLKKNGGTVLLARGSHYNQDGDEEGFGRLRRAIQSDYAVAGWLKYAAPAGGGAGTFDPDLRTKSREHLLRRKRDVLESYAALTEFWGKCKAVLCARSRPRCEELDRQWRLEDAKLAAMIDRLRAPNALGERTFEMEGLLGYLDWEVNDEVTNPGKDPERKRDGKAVLALRGLKTLVKEPCESARWEQSWEDKARHEDLKASRRRERPQAPR